MADVRCPMCSTVNPEGQNTCKVCGARLTPVTNEIAANNFQPIHPGDEPTKKSTAELEHALPDWLQELRKKQETGELQSPNLPATPVETPAPSSDSSETDDDFLSRLATAESGQDISTSAQPESTDWLAGLSETKGGDDDIPDWLLGVKQSVDEETQAAKLAAASQPVPEESVDWFQRLQEDQKAAKGEDASQWPGFYSESPGFGKTGLDERPVSKNESADWFMPVSESKVPEAPVPAPSTGVTDWLKKMQDQENKTPGKPPAVPISGDTSAAPLPDWLSFVQQTPTEPVTPAPAAAGEIPDWLSSFKADQASAADIPPAAPASAETLPDWLRAAQPAQPAAAPANLPSQPDQGEPDWLSTFGGAPAASAESVPAATKSKNDLPDWLAAAAAGAIVAESRTPDKQNPASVTSGISKPVTPPPAEQPVPQALDTSAESFTFDENVPDWLSDLPGTPTAAAIAASNKPTAPLPSITPAANQQPPAEKGEIPDWLVGATATAATAKAASVFTAQSSSAGDEALAMEMPDWLSGIKTGEMEKPATPVQGESVAAGSESLTPSELPSWVQAMRPVEAVIAETGGDVEDEQFVESQGPLAGFQNVLPFIPGLIAIRRPATYSSKLQVNSGQQTNAALLEGLLSSESDAARVKHVSGLHYNKFLRWMIALLLIILVAIPIILGSHLTPVNSTYPRELVAANTVINALPANSTVLVVFDYEPAFSGELAAASSPVLDQLLSKGANVAAVSSLPTGSVQANLMFETLLRSYNYLEGDKYINLGYVPGGAAGIYNFATNPATTIPTDVKGVQVWTTRGSFLSNMSQLSDFDAMLVIVDSSETARVWIEQSRLPLGSKPLLTVVSASSEPMVLPYYDSNQIQGMVTGLFGGAYYEKIIGRPGIGREYWDAFAVAFFVAEIIVVVGGIWALIAAWQSRWARKEEEA
jgi:hypothetical protein